MDVGNADRVRRADESRGVGVDPGTAGAEAERCERKVPAAPVAGVAPTWAQGHGIPVMYAEIVEGRIVLTTEDGSKVLAHIADIWRP